MKSWEYVDWQLEEAEEISNKTLKTSVQIMVELYDDKFIDNSMFIEFLFSVRADKQLQVFQDG